MKSRTRFVSLLCVFLSFLLLLFGALPAAANSAQFHWDGVDATGAIVTDGDCPIVVEKELLTFDIASFPKNYYDSLADFLAYDGRVTAEYTFYNPSSLDVTATLVFPFGTAADYAHVRDDEGNLAVNADTEKYGVLFNGETVEKRMRYTLADWRFDLQTDLSRLSDGYMEDGFYSPSLTVTKYSFKVTDVDFSAFSAATVAFDVAEEMGARRFYMPTQSGAHVQVDGSMRIHASADDFAELYVFGEPLDTLPTFTVYRDGGTENGEEIAGAVSLFDLETMTLSDLAFSNYDASRGVPEADWYNALVCELKDSGKYMLHPIVSCPRFENAFEGSLMRWYEYTIALAAGERVTNTVTAPIYPSIDLRYSPSVQGYTYLLSPARSWASFGALEIVVNTPYYITESSLDGFEKNEEGYKLSRNGLPQGELTFSLSASETPSRLPSYSGGTLDVYEYWPVAIIVLAVGLPIVLFFVIRAKRKKAFSKAKKK